MQMQFGLGEGADESGGIRRHEVILKQAIALAKGHEYG
jgi:hypothetical protein